MDSINSLNSPVICYWHICDMETPVDGKHTGDGDGVEDGGIIHAVLSY